MPRPMTMHPIIEKRSPDQCGEKSVISDKDGY